MKYEAIVFDNAGVLIDESHKRWSKKIADHFGQSADFIYQKYSRGKGWPLYKIGKISEDEFWQIGNKESGLDLDLVVLKKYVREVRIPNKEMVDFAKQLSKKYLLVLFTNEGREWHEYSENKELFYKLFTITIGSFSTGYSKPEPGIYLHLIKELSEKGIKAKESIYIDDRQNNLLAGESFGFNTILYKNINDLKKQLIEIKAI